METNTSSVLDDPRWHTFTTQGFACSCGEHHVGLFPIHLHHPVGWQGSDEYAADVDLQLEGNFLSSNYCVLEGKFFALRTRLPIQMRGAAPAAFMFTAWASLDRIDFESFTRDYRNGTLNKNNKVRARLVNRVGGYPDTFNLMGTAFQDLDGGPPLLLVHGVQAGMNSEHPLLADQRHGIDVDRMLSLFAAYGHEMRVPVANSN